jgi:4-hydroxy-tetrahydrodipicolinate synthase
MKSSDVHGSMVAIVTPFNERDEICFDALSELVQMHANSGTTGIVVCGTTGESPTLSHEEHEAAVARVVEFSKGTSLKVIAGTGSNSTAEAISLTEKAAEAGADACLVVTPYYNKPDRKGLLLHMKELDKVGLPIIYYNIPGRTGINVGPAQLIEILDNCPNLIGLKQSNGNLEETTELIGMLGDRDFSIMSGDDGLVAPFLSIGGRGVISVIANAYPKAMVELIRHYEQGQVDTAAKIMAAVYPLCSALLSLGPNPVPVKSLLCKLGTNVGGCRLPLAILDDSKADQLVAQADAMIAKLKTLGVDATSSVCV